MPNSASSLIGHVIYSFDQIEAEGLFCLDNLLIIVAKEKDNIMIREYKVSKEYRVKYNRAYPTYHYSIKEGGTHTHN